MRGLCWNHWFRPLCACVLPDLSRIYSGFIRIRVRSRRSDKNTVKNVYEMETRFMADLCRIYSPFELFQEERPKKKGAINPIPRLAWGQTGGRIYDPQINENCAELTVLVLMLKQ